MEKFIIDEFPNPYYWDATPYKCKEFSKETLNVVRSHTKLMTNVAKAIFVGEMSVGKTSIVSRFCEDKFHDDYRATIGVDFEIQNFKVRGTPFTLQMWDTAGQERFKCIAQAYYRNTNVIVIVFDMTNENSLNTAPIWLESAKDVNKSIAVVFLVGTKSDLLPKRKVQYVEEQAKIIAKNMGAEYWSVSAKTGYCISDLFRRIAALSFDAIMRQYYVENLCRQNQVSSIKMSSSTGTKFTKSSVCSSC